MCYINGHFNRITRSSTKHIVLPPPRHNLIQAEEMKACEPRATSRSGNGGRMKMRKDRGTAIAVVDDEGFYMLQPNYCKLCADLHGAN